MNANITAPYEPGISVVAPVGAPLPQERKSPPLSTVTPQCDRYLQIDPTRYYAPEHLQREWDKLWTKTWLCAGRVSDLPQVGSWLRFDIGRESFIIVRSGEQEIRALYNVCQHRGNRIVDEPFGRANGSFICSYHSWRYALSGENIRVTDSQYFKPGALCGRIGMRAARCETWGGFVFINMDDNARPLTEYLGEVAELMAPYRMEQMHVVRDVLVDLECNWKVMLDAFSENYHVHITHPQAMPAIEDVKVQMDFYAGGHSRRITPLGDPSSRRGKVTALDPVQKMFLADGGIDPERFEGGPYGVRRALQQAKRGAESPTGVDYSGFADGQLTDDWATNVFPNMHWSAHPEGVLFMRYYPHASDPNRAQLHINVLCAPLKEGVRPPMYMGVPPEVDVSGKTRPQRVQVKASDPNAEEVIGMLLYQDIRNTRESQRGLQSRGFEAIRLSELEQCLQHQHAEMDRYLNAP